MKFFKTKTDVTDYAADGLVASLQDDLDRMTYGAEARFYSDEERNELAARLEDIRTIAPLITNAPRLLDACKIALERLALNNWDGEEDQFIMLLQTVIARSDISGIAEPYDHIFKAAMADAR